jgi:predicted S18 family serine protease
MKKLILLVLILFSLNSQAQYKVKYEKDNIGLVITGSGLVLGTIALFVKDGGEYTYANGYNSNKIKVFPTNRAIMFGISCTVSIGGLFYQRSHK